MVRFADNFSAQALNICATIFAHSFLPIQHVQISTTMPASRPRKIYRAAAFFCHFLSCRRGCKTSGGLRRHLDAVHGVKDSISHQQRRQHSPSALDTTGDNPGFSDGAEEPDIQDDTTSLPSTPPNVETELRPARESPNPPESLRDAPTPPLKHRARIVHHPILDGTPCDVNGDYISRDTNPPCGSDHNDLGTWPFQNVTEFEFAEFLYTEEQMSGKKIDKLMSLMAQLNPQDDPPFADHDDLYTTIDSIPLGDVPWQSFNIRYSGSLPEDDIPPWMTEEYEVWFRDPLKVMEQQIANPDFAEEFDFSPKHVFDSNGKRQYGDLMSGNWAWEQAVRFTFHVSVPSSFSD